jgi:membrane-associated phospholipid phosphatase
MPQQTAAGSGQEPLAGLKPGTTVGRPPRRRLVHTAGQWQHGWVLNIASKVDWVLLRKAATRRSRATGLLGQATEATDGAKLWVAVALILAAVGGRRGRRAAAQGVSALVVVSPLVNGVLKQLSRRRRPTGILAVGLRQRGHAPKTSSCPSGHAASAAAFAVAASAARPVLTLPLVTAAAVTGFSRVQAGRHFPTDVVAGAAVGATCGWATHMAWSRMVPVPAAAQSSSPTSGLVQPEAHQVDKFSA